jgi:hypothetical protein
MHLTSNHHISRLTLPCVFATHSHSNGYITSHFLAAREKPEREKWCSFIQSCCRRRKRHFVPTVANRTRTATARLLQHITAYCADLCISSVCEYMRISYVYFCVCARVCPNMRCRLQRNGCAQIALLSCRFLEMVQRCVVLFPVSRISFGAGKLVGSVLTSVVFCKFYWNACVNAGACCSCVRHRNCCSKLAAVPLCFADRSGAK